MRPEKAKEPDRLEGYPTYKQSARKTPKRSPHRRRDRSIDRPERRTQLFDEARTRVGDLGPSLVAVKKSDASELSLHTRYRAANRPMRAAQTLSGGRVATCLRHRHDSLEIGKRECHTTTLPTGVAGPLRRAASDVTLKFLPPPAETRSRSVQQQRLERKLGERIVELTPDFK